MRLVALLSRARRGTCARRLRGRLADDSLTVYSGREEELVQPLFDMFEDETGIDGRRALRRQRRARGDDRRGGRRLPADVFFAQDPGSLGAVDEAARGAAAGDARPRRRALPRRRRPLGRDLGPLARARLQHRGASPADRRARLGLRPHRPERWKGKVGIAPTNASFQAFVTAMRLTAGEERRESGSSGLKENEPKTYEKNTPIVEAVADRRDRARARQPLLPLPRQGGAARCADREPLPAKGDPGALVSVAGAGVARGRGQQGGRAEFVAFLLSDEGAALLHRRGGGGGVPARRRHPGRRRACRRSTTLEGPDVDLSTFGAEL